MKYRDLEDRLLSNSVLDVETGCWVWIGYRNPKGYGELTVRVGRTKSRKLWAHRVAYSVFKGPIPPSMEIDHQCLNTSCICPDHLALRTKSENSRRLHSR